MKVSSIFLNAIPIIETIKQHGYEAYFVGGAVRDYFLHRPVHDVDIATSALPNEVMTIFSDTIPLATEHGTVIVRYEKEQYEVTTFRKEEAYVDFRHPEKVQFIRRLEEDLKRRDFTMNALAMTSQFEVIDLFSGKKDIDRKLIRTVGNPDDRFQEDPLRIMRAVRFSSQLCFQLEKETKQAMRRQKEKLAYISVERISQEMDRLWLGPCVSQSLTTMKELQLFSVLPGAKWMTDTFILSFDGFEQCETLEQAWTLFAYIAQVSNLSTFLRTWKFSRERMKKITILYEGIKAYQDASFSDYDRFQLGKTFLLDVVRLYAILSNENVETCIRREATLFDALPIKHEKELAITAQEIIEIVQKKPGPWIRECQKEIIQGILDKKMENDYHTLKEWINRWHQH